jgi:phosphoserine phosphatase RsbU/P
LFWFQHHGFLDRVSALIDNLLDFARGRLGGGIALKRAPQSLQPVLNHVIAELRANAPDQKIETLFDLTEPVDCDGTGIGQLFSNPLGNALTHGTAREPVRVRATTGNGAFLLSVANSGDPIPAEAKDRLFQPFYRLSAKGRPGRPGIGLYIAAEIARAHHGSIEVSSSAEETRFTFQMPLR